MLMQSEIEQKLQSAFEPQQAEVLLEVISLSYNNLVKVSDFTELKAIVQELAESQKAMGIAQDKTSGQIENLTAAQNKNSSQIENLTAAQNKNSSQIENLTAAQNKNSSQIENLTAAQNKNSSQIENLTAAQNKNSSQIENLTAAQNKNSSQIENLTAAQNKNSSQIENLTAAQNKNSSQIENLTAAIKELAIAQQRTEKQVAKLTSATSDIRSEIGGMSRSMSYALENEAYRALPAFLLDKHGIEVTERLIRAPVNNEEINFFGRAVRDGKPVLIVGESKQRLDERRSSKREEDRIFSQLETKANIVRAAHPDEEIALLLITHYARPEFLRTAAERGIIVVQSFEW